MTSIYENKNSFWPEYKNLEKQVIDLTNHVCFCDEQVNVFSRENSNLILQIGSEIESISKELHRRYYDESKKKFKLEVDKLKKHTRNPNKLQFDYDCLADLDTMWLLRKKEICVTGVNFYFRNELSSCAPLEGVYVLCECNKENKNTSTDESNSASSSTGTEECNSTSNDKKECKCKCQWKLAYNALKHNNRASIEKATIKNLMSALGALFVLNLYYRDLNCDDYKFYLKGDLFDSRVGSEIFSVNCYEVPTLIRGIEMGDHSIDGISQDELAKAIYIKKYDDESMKFMHRMCCLDYHQVLKNFETAPELQPYRDNPDSEEYKDLNEEQICYKIGGLDLVTKIFNYENTEKTIRMTLGREILLNTHSRIYDTVTYDDFKRYYEEEVKKRRIERFYPGLSSIHKP